MVHFVNVVVEPITLIVQERSIRAPRLQPEKSCPIAPLLRLVQYSIDSEQGESSHQSDIGYVYWRPRADIRVATTSY